MGKSTVARPYAQALLELAREGGSMDRVAADIKHFASHFSNASLRAMLFCVRRRRSTASSKAWAWSR